MADIRSFPIPRFSEYRNLLRAELLILRWEAYPFGAPAQAFEVSSTVHLIELHVILENRFVIPRNPQGVVDVEVRFRPLQQRLVFEPFEVGKIAQCREPKNLQEFLRRDVGEGRAGFWRAQEPRR